MNIENKKFGELLKASMKSDDTEEWLDIHFTRPIGLAFALLWHRLGVTPNTITLLSIVLGIAAGAMFYFQNLYYNIIGVILLISANLCDSTDGQLARLTNQRSMKGRCLDGFQATHGSLLSILPSRYDSGTNQCREQPNNGAHSH